MVKIHSKLSVNKLLSSSRAEALNLVLKSVTELQLHIICSYHQKYAMVMEKIKCAFSQKQQVAAKMAAIWKWYKQAYYQSQKQLTGTVQKTNYSRGHPSPSFWLSACLSPAHPLINKYKMVPHYSPHQFSPAGVSILRKPGRGGN